MDNIKGSLNIENIKDIVDMLDIIGPHAVELGFNIEDVETMENIKVIMKDNDLQKIISNKDSIYLNSIIGIFLNKRNLIRKLKKIIEIAKTS